MIGTTAASTLMEKANGLKQRIQQRSAVSEQRDLLDRQASVEECYLALRALDQWDRILRLNPREAEAYGRRALTLMLLGRKAEAREDMERAVSLGLDRGQLLEEFRELRKMSLDLGVVNRFGVEGSGRWLRPAAMLNGLAALMAR